MIYNASDFVFRAPPVISRARRVLIKPSAGYPVPYPVTTSHGMLAMIIEGIRRISDADIIILEATPTKESVYPVYQALGYNFPRVLMLDAKDSVWVEVENPLPKPFAIDTFCVPNTILSSDYLISVAPLKVVQGQCNLTIANLLPVVSGTETSEGKETLRNLGIDKVITDLYFTLPFDLGIIEASQKFVTGADPAQGQAEEYGKIFIGDPLEVDREACEALGLRTEYLELIKMARAGFET